MIISSFVERYNIHVRAEQKLLLKLAHLEVEYDLLAFGANRSTEICNDHREEGRVEERIAHVLRFADGVF